METVTGVSVTRDSFRVLAFIPDDLVSLRAEEDWAAWAGVHYTRVAGRSALVLVSITVTPFAPQPGSAASAALAATVRARHPEPGTVIEEFTTQGGCAAVALRSCVTQEVRGQDVTTGQAQVLVMYPGPGALGVISGLCFHPDDLDRAAVIVTGIAAQMTVTGVTAAA
jgi:hypothetical protein